MSTAAKAWPAPGKINRFLHITGRRADGYHLLQTLFQFISLQDTVHIQVRARGDVRRGRGADGVAAADDLAIRAAQRLRAEADSPAGATIDIDKRIPMGGGLGGGSSDAATVLVALNHLWDLHLPLAELARLGLELGADVPVFVLGRAAWAEGVGETLTPVCPDEPWLALLTPDCAVDTGRIFASGALTRNTQFLTISRLFPGNVASGPNWGRTASTGASPSAAGAAIGAALAHETHNDCTAVTSALYPPVARALELLETRVGGARMTGTGASVFAPLTVSPARCGASSECDGRDASGNIDGSEESAANGDAPTGWLRDLPRGWRGAVVRLLNRSPLRDCVLATGCEACAALCNSADSANDSIGV